MALPLYLARTKAEMEGNCPLSARPAYMACHFSSAGPGLSNFPDTLPAGTMLILDDSTPFRGHDPKQILREIQTILEQHRCECLLLDFQRPGNEEQQSLAKAITASLPCPVGVSELYAAGLNCPVFCSPLPPDRPLDTHLAPWKGREIWLEAALEGLTLTLTEAGCNCESFWDFPENGLTDNRLYCHYTIETPCECAIFRLWRTREDLNKLLKAAEFLGVTKAIGLWQELARDT